MAVHMSHINTNIFNITKSFLLYILLFSVIINTSSSLYEDQIGKFDWRKQFIGQVKNVYLEESGEGSPPKLVVATKENTLASLNIRNGELVWRYVFEKNEQGQIEALSSSSGLVSVSDNGPTVRTWDSSAGILTSETSFYSPSNQIPDQRSFNLENGKGSEGEQLVMAELFYGSHIKITIFKLGSTSKKSSPDIAAPWLQKDTTCKFVTGDYFLCLSHEGLHLLPIINNGVFISIPLSTFGIPSLSSFSDLSLSVFPTQKDKREPMFGLSVENESTYLLQIQPPGIKMLKKTPWMFQLDSVVLDDKFYLVNVTKTDIDYQVQLLDPETWESDFEGGFEVAETQGGVEKIFLLPYTKKDMTMSYKILVVTKDHSLQLYYQIGKLIWSREEALATILSAELVDLSLSETESDMEKEFGQSNGSIVNMFVMRLSAQLIHFYKHIVNLVDEFKTEFVPVSDTDISKSVLTRDKFGLHKIIVAVTVPGKVYGINSLNGQIVWTYYDSQLQPLKDSTYLVFMQRTTAFYPYPAQITIIGKQKDSSRSYLLSLDPTTGNKIDSIALPYEALQVSLIAHVNEEHMRGIVMLDRELNIHVYPSSCQEALEASKDNHYIYVADPVSGTLNGYSLSPFPNGKALPAWNIKFPEQSQTIVTVVGKRFSEHVHSQGRVLGNRGVLYKYLNPNLALVITEGLDNTQKTNLNVYFTDVVTGAIVYAASHKRARGPVNVVHSENWAIYSYFNDRARRMEISAVELFEGTAQSNTTAFSSLSPPPNPLVEHQTFIFPAGIETMVDTVTERGLTNKHLLIALPAGGIVEIPRVFLDPRRPIFPTNEHREEGLIPYVPELTIPSEGMVNYNQSLVHVRGIHTAPSGLESTCLVFAYGLDTFFTRVMPSKTFDVLKEDFDYSLILAVQVLLVALSFATKRLASLKLLRQAWK